MLSASEPIAASTTGAGSLEEGDSGTWSAAWRVPEGLPRACDGPLCNVRAVAVWTAGWTAVDYTASADSVYGAISAALWGADETPRRRTASLGCGLALASPALGPGAASAWRDGGAASLDAALGLAAPPGGRGSRHGSDDGPGGAPPPGRGVARVSLGGTPLADVTVRPAPLTVTPGGAVSVAVRPCPGGAPVASVSAEIVVAQRAGRAGGDASWPGSALDAAEDAEEKASRLGADAGTVEASRDAASTVLDAWACGMRRTASAAAELRVPGLAAATDGDGHGVETACALRVRFWPAGGDEPVALVMPLVVRCPGGRQVVAERTERVFAAIRGALADA